MIKTTRRGVLLEGLCWLAEWDHVTQGDRRQLYDFLQLRTHSDIVLFPIGIVLACIYSYPTSHSITGSKLYIERFLFVILLQGRTLLAISLILLRILFNALWNVQRHPVFD